MVAHILPKAMLAQIVIDTNILVSGLRSRRGASYLLLELVGKGYFDINLSVPLVIEYEDVLYRHLPQLAISKVAIDAVIDFHCSVANKHQIFFLWRPFLRDPKDDMVLELAVKAECDYIVTHNKRDFRGVTEFGIKAVTPGDFLIEQGLV